MTSSNEIKAKKDQLKIMGFDLGPKVGSEQAAHSGGKVQIYRNGHIYWHPNSGAHEVHGGILAKYLEEGGPGPHPRTGRRHFGYPTSDETRRPDPRYPISRFEFGEIDFVAGTGGGVSLYGDFFKSASPDLGFPLTEPLQRAGGEVVYFERGCQYKGPSTSNKIITCTLTVPTLGRTEFIAGQDTQGVRFGRFATWSKIPKDVLASIQAERPRLFNELWNSQLQVRRINKPGSQTESLPLLTDSVTFEGQSEQGANVFLGFRIPTSGDVRLRGRSLYDIIFALPGGAIYIIAPHAYYTRDRWESFGFIHATDIHVARRLDGFRSKLRELATKLPDLADAPENFNNFNDAFRELIRYANHLHDIKMIDFILATGDIVDYGFEKGDPGSRNNYAFLEQLIRGQAPSPEGVISEELRVPIFTTFGNHDYRVNPYTIYGTLDIPIHKDADLPMYPPYNLTDKEIIALQGGKPKISLTDGHAMVEVDNRNQRRSYDYYFNRINPETSYTLTLGPHRIVMLDTRSDAGLPSVPNWQHLAATFLNFMFDAISEDTKRAIASGPNLLGILDSDLDLVTKALNGAHELGMVIVGMHAPPLNIEGSEFSHFLRETEHPTAERREIYAFLLRKLNLAPLGPRVALAIKPAIFGRTDDKLPQSSWDAAVALVDRTVSSDVWPRTDTAHFKAGDTKQFLDDGVASGKNTVKLLQLCAGQGASRPADLVLCGHNHDRVEYRIKWSKETEDFRFFTDFYLENPELYYPSTKLSVNGSVHINVKEGAPLNGKPRTRRDKRFDPPREYNLLDVPPYADPLDRAANARFWWEQHRPVIAESAALGPMDHSQRTKGSERPPATFQGFRVFTVNSNVINRCHYVRLEELRRHNFKLPWEKSAPLDGTIDPRDNDEVFH